jgi:hypothetical protein
MYEKSTLYERIIKYFFQYFNQNYIILASILKKLYKYNKNGLKWIKMDKNE